MGSGRIRTLRAAAEFQHVYKTGRTVHGPSFTVRFARAADDRAAFGFVVSTKVSKSAVVRNRIRRRVREFVRRAGTGSGRDVVVIAKPAAARLSPAATVSELSSLFKQATLIR